MTDYSVFSGTGGHTGLTPPASSVSFASPITVGSQFRVTTGGLYLKGYQYWVADSGGNHGPQKFALWAPDPNGTSNTLISAGTVTSGTFTTGQWNAVLLSTPIPLTPQVTYLAATGFTGNFNETKNFWNTGGSGVAGLSNGPLDMYSDVVGNGGTDAPNFGHVQSGFSTSGGDPAVNTPQSADSSFNCWIDVIVTDQAPAGSVYRAFPNWPVPAETPSTDHTGYTLGMEFSLSQASTLEKIWHYSAPTSTDLPTRCLIWNVGTTSAVSGTDNSSPSWLLPGGGAASAGGGWVYVDYSGSGVTLNASTNYKVSTFHAPAAVNWFAVITHFWDTGPGGSGLTYGPLSLPNNASASPGQNSWNAGSFGYPNTSTSPELDLIDVEVIPQALPYAPRPLFVRQAVNRSASY